MCLSSLKGPYSHAFSCEKSLLSHSYYVMVSKRCIVSNRNPQFHFSSLWSEVVPSAAILSMWLYLLWALPISERIWCFLSPCISHKTLVFCLRDVSSTLEMYSISMRMLTFLLQQLPIFHSSIHVVNLA